MTLILASRSAARHALLASAGVPFETMAAGVDEEAAKASLRASGIAARDLADALAELKATRLSSRLPGALVLGCDQVLRLADGSTLDKPGSREEAGDQLRRLRGATHRLISAAVICEGGSATWRQVEEVRLTVRDFTELFLKTYLDAEWPAIGGCVGAYRAEGLGMQLFSRIDGSQAAILGLPLLGLLEHLRVRGVIPR